jgi:hypothetical protein
LAARSRAAGQSGIIARPLRRPLQDRAARRGPEPHGDEEENVDFRARGFPVEAPAVSNSTAGWQKDSHQVQIQAVVNSWGPGGPLARGIERMFGVYLSALPRAARVFCTLFLVGIGAGSVAALTQVATAVGLTPGEVQASLAPEMPMTHVDHGSHGAAQAGQEISLDELSQAARVWIRTPLLIQTSHTHLFGQTLIAGLLGLILLFSSLGEWKKALIVALPFVGTLLDIGSMWLTRFVWPGFSYGLIAARSLYEPWLQREARA